MGNSLINQQRIFRVYPENAQGEMVNFTGEPEIIVSRNGFEIEDSGANYTNPETGIYRFVVPFTIERGWRVGDTYEVEVVGTVAGLLKRVGDAGQVLPSPGHSNGAGDGGYGTIGTVPLVITVDSVRQNFSTSPTLTEFMEKLGDTDEQDEKIAKKIALAQGEIENRTRCFLTRKRIRTRPAIANLDGTPGVKGVDYDLEEDAYDWFRGDWSGGWVDLKLRRHPVQSVESVMVRYGASEPMVALTTPEQWNVANHADAVLNILPLIGISSMQATTLLLMPVLGHAQGNRNRDRIPQIVTVNYTAGYLPSNFDPETDDPFLSNPDQDVRGLLEAVEYLAAARLLTTFSPAMDARGGSLSMNGFSESTPQGLLSNAAQALEQKAAGIIDLYNQRAGLGDLVDSI